MQIPSPLSEADLTIKLQYIEGWSVQAGKLHEEYVFDDSSKSSIRTRLRRHGA